MKATRVGVVLAGVVLCASGCSNPFDPPEAGTPAGDSATEATAEPEDTDPGEGGDSDDADEDWDETFTIVSTGDVLIHTNVIDSAETGDGYDFAPLMEPVAEWISGADLALCSLEVPIKPAGEEPVGYPVFGAPPELIPSLAEVGFHGCNTATNHSLDSGVEGLERTLDTFDEHGMGHVGTARTEAEAASPQLYTLQRGDREITVAHLSTTELHNDPFYPPQDAPWMVTDDDPEVLTDMAAQAREEGADVVVASVHWGEEYVHEPGPEQIQYAEALAAGGEIDLIYGNHSHTPQPIEQLDGGPGDEGVWVVWSMGNFLSNQDEQCCVMETATGTMAVATVEAPEGEPARVTALEWAPVTVDRGPEDEDGHRGIWPLLDLYEDGAPEPVELDEATIQRRWERIAEVMGEDSLRTDPPEPTGEDPEVIPRTQD
ncbi:CapA family protein [Nesterenkonia alba]|uniref:CapA family protein n=1 Tax=Nesterenkonia alba TaxID=515814 RepID=UPI0003B58D75|nr:CapA family protein [Nesterenkonia alba]